MTDDQLSEVRCTYLGFIFQAYNLLPQYTVVENIELPLSTRGSRSTTDDDAPGASSLAEMVGLGGRASTTGRCNSPAASSSASPSPAAWSTTRNWSSPTSRPATSTAARRTRS